MWFVQTVGPRCVITHYTAIPSNKVNAAVYFVVCFFCFVFSFQGRRGVTNTATGPENSHPLSSQEVLISDIRQNFSLQYQNNIKQTSYANKKISN